MVTGEGGMVTTDNAAWAARIKMLALHGERRRLEAVLRRRLQTL